MSGNGSKPRAATRADGSRRIAFGRLMAVTVLIISQLAMIAGQASAAVDEGPNQPAPLLMAADGAGIDGAYIVVLDDDADGGDAAGASDRLERLVETGHARITQRFRSVLTGFAAELDDTAVAQLRLLPSVAYIEQDSLMAIATEQSNPEWGLDRIDQQTLPLDNSYTYNEDGAGVAVYVVDTGIRSTHAQLAGRVAGGQSFIGGNAEDCNGHGTHVAGTVAATRYGVAKSAEVYGLRVLSCTGSGPVSATVAALDWVRANATGPSVVNMSLSGPKTTSMTTAVNQLYNAGIVSVVAAGNNNRDACDESPANIPNAITVAATTVSDTRSSFSNWGPCVDLFAPGSSVRSLGITSNTATRVLSGTSMATPHVAGAAALYLDANPTATPNQVTSAVLGGASTGQVSDNNGSPNLLLYSLLGQDIPPPPLPPPPAAPTVDVVSQTVTETNRSQTIKIAFELNQAATTATRVKFTTNDGTAVRNNDYSRRIGTVYFAKGQTRKTINITIRGDANPEPTEQFTVDLHTPTGLTLGTNATITIEDEDVPGPTVDVVSQTVTETNRSQTIKIAFELDQAATTATRVKFTTNDGTAVRNNDYSRRIGTVYFAKGQTRKTINITIRGDANPEPTEQFTVDLHTPTGLTLGTNATITIEDEDL